MTTSTPCPLNQFFHVPSMLADFLPRPSLSELRIVLRGGGDIATGVALRLHRAGLRSLIILERSFPLAVRRTVALCEAVHDGMACVEGLVARRVDERGSELEECLTAIWAAGDIPVLVDPDAALVASLAPHVLIEATLAKRNVGVRLADAPLVIGVGPGFHAGVDVSCIIESNRGARLGRVLDKGSAEPDTGVPGEVGGESVRRLLRAPTDGVFVSDRQIGCLVGQGDVVAEVGGVPVCAALGGIVRGLIRTGTRVKAGWKVGDVDPRPETNCHEVSDKALAIGGGVLEAIMRWQTEPLYRSAGRRLQKGEL